MPCIFTCLEHVAPLFMVLPYSTPPRNVTYFPETNVLLSINNVVAESNKPAAKFIRIKIRRHVPETMSAKP